MLNEKDLTLLYHEELNPVLWDDFNLKSSIRTKLLAIANEWIKSADIPQAAIHDIIMGGGNCNFNYTQFSDIDVHIVVDKSKMSPDQKLLDAYLMLKKSEWASKHRAITIKGYSVELYAQDISETYPQGEGVFSLARNEWIQKPVNLHLNFSNDKKLQDKADHWEAVIDKMIADDVSIEKLYAMKQKFHNMRVQGLVNGEFGFENLLFKELRNRGVFNKMNDFILSKYDRSLSEDSPTNSIGSSVGGNGPIATYTPLLLNKILRRKKNVTQPRT